jgi:hypothetical protein
VLFSRLSILKDAKSFAVVTDALRACTAPSSSSSSYLAPPGSSGPGSSGTGNRRTGQQRSTSSSTAGVGSRLAEGEGGGEELKLGVWVALRQMQRMSKALTNMALFKGTVLNRQPFILSTFDALLYALLGDVSDIM